MGRLIIDGNKVYELDENCLRRKNQEKGWMNPEKKQGYHPQHPSEQGKK